MFTDIELGVDMNKRFQVFVSNREASLEGLSHSVSHEVFSTVIEIVRPWVDVLTTGSWPLHTQKSTSLLLPRLFEEGFSLFDAFYRSQHNGRRLVWHYHLCKGELKCHGFDKKYELSASLYQIVILLSLNEEAKTFGQLKTSTGLRHEELTNHLKVWILLVMCNLCVHFMVGAVGDPTLDCFGGIRVWFNCHFSESFVHKVGFPSLRHRINPLWRHQTVRKSRSKSQWQPKQKLPKKLKKHANPSKTIVACIFK